MRAARRSLVPLAAVLLGGSVLVAGAAPAVAQDDAPRLVVCLGAAADGSPVFPLKEVPANHREVVVVWRLREGETAKKLTHVWTVVDVGGAAPAGTVIAKETLGLKGLTGGVLRYSLPRDLPVGSYRIDVTADETAWPPLAFRVGAPTKPTPLAKPADLLPLAAGTTWRYDLVYEAGPIVKNVTLPGTEKAADGTLHGPATYTAAETDADGTRIEMRRGDVLANEEWWRLDDRGLFVTKERQGKEEARYDPPVATIRLPLGAPTAWEHTSKDGSFRRNVRAWGPLPLGGYAGDAPGYVLLSTQPTGNGVLSIERWFVPGVGVVRETQTQTAVGRLLTRLSLVLRPGK